MARVKRFDFARLPTKGTRTPQGFLKVPAHVTGVGIFAYRRRDGKLVRELRPPDEVFRADSMATLRGAPVTDLHPSEMVKPSNVRTHQIGFIDGDARRDGTKVAADPVVQDERMITAVERRDRVEVSCGYDCDFDPTPGKFDGTNYGPHVTTGEAYDGVQRNIVYNHVALGPRNWGRQGKDVALKLDAKGEIDLADDDAWEERTDSADPTGSPQPPVGSDPSAAPRAPRGNTMDPKDLINLRIDSVDYEVPKAAAPHIAKAIETRDATITALTAERDKLKGRADASDKALEDANKKLATAEDPKRLDSLVTARTSLVSNATKVLGKDVKLDGLTERQVHETVLKKLDDKLDLAKESDAYVAGRFDAAIAAAPAGNKSPARAALGGRLDDDDQDGDGDDDDGRNDADDDDGGKAKSKRRDESIPAWQKPLAISNER
jgi:hypothetical protein